MKRFALLLASAAFATPAVAADVIYEEPLAPAPMTIEPVATTATWTGLYIGGQAGFAFGNDSDNISFDPGQNGIFGNGTFDSGNDNNAGFVGGAHIGYDYQMPSNIVIGAVADINYIDAETSRSYTVRNPFNGNLGTFGVNEEVDYFGTVRGRLGYALDNVLLYGTGGLAYAGYNRETYAPSTTSGFGAGYTFQEDDDDADVGYAVGGGIDFLAAQNLSFGVEYLYTNLGSNDYSVTATNTDSRLNFTTRSDSEDLDFHTIWAKASYRFN